MTGQTSHAGGWPLTGSGLGQELERRVLAGEWTPGSRIPSERQIAEQYGVSRPIVREALRGLRERGLIAVAAGRGSFVREVRPTVDGGSPELLARRGGVTAHDLVVARSMLEGEAAALAARVRTDADVAQMARILQAFEETTSITEAAALDVAFHESIAVAAGNPVIQLMFGSIRTLTHGVVLRSLTDETVRRVADPLHSAILDAIVAQDPQRARAAMVDHIGAARRLYGADLDAPLVDVLDRRAEVAPALRDLLHDVSDSIHDEAERRS